MPHAAELRGRDLRIEAVERDIGVKISPPVREWAIFAADLWQAGISGRAMRSDFTLGWNPVTAL